MLMFRRSSFRSERLDVKKIHFVVKTSKQGKTFRLPKTHQVPKVGKSRIFQQINERPSAKNRDVCPRTGSLCFFNRFITPYIFPTECFRKDQVDRQASKTAVLDVSTLAVERASAEKRSHRYTQTQTLLRQFVVRHPYPYRPWDFCALTLILWSVSFWGDFTNSVPYMDGAA